MKTTLKDIQSKSPCFFASRQFLDKHYPKLLKKVEENYDWGILPMDFMEKYGMFCDETITLRQIYKTCGFLSAIWSIRCFPDKYDKHIKQFVYDIISQSFDTISQSLYFRSRIYDETLIIRYLNLLEMDIKGDTSDQWNIERQKLIDELNDMYYGDLVYYLRNLDNESYKSSIYGILNPNMCCESMTSHLEKLMCLDEHPIITLWERFIGKYFFEY